jgi:hypothetical protein
MIEELKRKQMSGRELQISNVFTFIYQCKNIYCATVPAGHVS